MKGSYCMLVFFANLSIMVAAIRSCFEKIEYILYVHHDVVHDVFFMFVHINFVSHTHTETNEKYYALM